jgi:hypothetical protein
VACADYLSHTRGSGFCGEDQRVKEADDYANTLPLEFKSDLRLTTANYYPNYTTNFDACVCVCCRGSMISAYTFPCCVLVFRLVS